MGVCICSLDGKMIGVLVLTSETIGDIKHPLLSPATKQYADDTFLVANFAHSIEMVHHAEQDQRMDDYFVHDRIFCRHFA